ncbi:bifunctional folylpolyglutamate synthase/dihydrofolate synthase [Chitinispirillales bacterium ANBcel5]|uniref:bifunctional folylpolyglutamate synthase/dihydrofolate synthase n=1 Tax=Cellulosispirillum alkaliphilum TaxID=3039283 RepID=UPI002A543222|nr:bifunctional folylpolyglutamate synthase/dihydrofolate synthase [Chitinispirillales bacterium ANBcel5]
MIKKAESIRKHLFSLQRRGIKYELERMERAARRCGYPHLSHKCIHVAGTNGKGSTCTMIQTALTHLGFKTGLFTSPHLICFEERFKVDGKAVLEEEWVEVYHELEEIIDSLGLTFFEASTLMAFELFKRKGVEWAVYETGMGGRLDATNIVKPQVSVITPIAMDHTEFLGPTLKHIANEKLGIVKKGVPVYVAKPRERDVSELIKTHCAQQNTNVSFVSQNEAENIDTTENGIKFWYKNTSFSMPLYGRFQVLNSLLAINALLGAGVGEIETIADALSSVQIRGRFQVEQIGNKTVVIDVAHNEDAAKMLSQTLKEHFDDKSKLMVCGVMKDKDYESMIHEFTSEVSEIVLCKPQIQRAANPEDLERFTAHFTGKVRIIRSVSEALNYALTSNHELLCVAGSFYTAGEAISALKL